MKIKALLFLYFLFVFNGYAHAAQSDNELDDRILKFGLQIESNQALMNDLDAFAKTPSLSVRLFIKEIHAITETVIVPSDTDMDIHKSSMHVIWCIRALRYLTGENFTGRTEHKFDKKEKDRKYWLTIHNKTDLPFFSVWMSRDVIYIAPPDVQAQVIKKWEAWYSRFGETHTYEPKKDIAEWYY